MESGRSRTWQIASAGCKKATTPQKGMGTEAASPDAAARSYGWAGPSSSAAARGDPEHEASDPGMDADDAGREAAGLLVLLLQGSVADSEGGVAVPGVAWPPPKWHSAATSAGSAAAAFTSALAVVGSEQAPSSVLLQPPLATSSLPGGSSAAPLPSPPPSPPPCIAVQRVHRGAGAVRRGARRCGVAPSLPKLARCWQPDLA
mmetsp:Transcript_128952/g.412978  ORF Transcript_128952/g.412978 Transcript_128952/m.412978 type:complete len:203 (+) Transcript_128952:1318-1926(+)